MLLVNRLNKRVTILRPISDDEWLGSATVEGTKEFSTDKTYDGEEPGKTLIQDWFGDNRDGYGQPIDELVPVATVWAAIEPLRGREYFFAMTEHAEVTTRIRIRYREDVDRTMVVRYKDKEFEILHIIQPEFNKKELQLMCKERQ